MVREGRVFISPTAGKPQYGIGYYVTAYEVGAQVAAASSGTTVTVRAGHGFAAGDKYMNGTDTGTFSGTLTVQSVTATTLVLSSAYAVAEGDLLVNLAADTGTAAPNYDGAGLTIYTDMDYTNQATYNTVLTDSYGRYRYFHQGTGIWELVRDTTGSPIAIYVNASAGEGLSPSSISSTFGSVAPAGFSSGSGSGGVYINKSSTVAQSLSTGFYHDGIERWSLGEDYIAGDRSYFALWSDKGVVASGVWASSDVLAIAWGGAESQLAGNTPRIAGQQGVDGPKWRFNQVFTPGSNPDTYSDPYQFYFNCPTLQASGSGVYAALFQSALNAGVATAFDSGGVQVNVSGAREGLKIINQTLGGGTRASYVIVGAGGSTGYKFGCDIAGANTQNWGIYDYASTSYRVYIDPDGMVAIGGTSPNQQLDVNRSQNADTCIQVTNVNQGTSARAGFVAAAYNSIYLKAFAFESGYATYGGHTALFSGTGSRLYLGTANVLHHYFDAAAPGTFVMAAATTAGASIRLAHGAAPSSPVNGDMWTTTAGLYVRINGATVGPLT